MKWEEVRDIYPNQFVKLQILKYHIKDNKKYIDDMAVVRGIKDNREATQELVNSKEDTIVYHTNNEEIVIQVKNVKNYRGII